MLAKPERVFDRDREWAGLTRFAANSHSGALLGVVSGGIANFIGRKSADLTHPLNVLEDCSLVAREPDVFRRGRWTYRIAEPLINFYEAVMRPEWFRLEAGQAESAWRAQAPDFYGRVVGPHFESICRTFAQSAGEELFGLPVGEVGAGVVNDPEARSQIEVDVVVFAPAAPGQSRKIVSLGEVKWGETMSHKHIGRLARARDLLSADFDTSDCVLACYSAAGFHQDLRDEEQSRLVRVTLDDIYGIGAFP